MELVKTELILVLIIEGAMLRYGGERKNHLGELCQELPAQQVQALIKQNQRTHTKENLKYILIKKQIFVSRRRRTAMLT